MGQHRAGAQHRGGAPERTVRLNERLAALFASGHAADLVLLVMGIEAIVLVRLRRLGPRAILAAALPGALIVIALRAALMDAPWPWIALPLLLSWPAHLGDLWLRSRELARRR